LAASERSGGLYRSMMVNGIAADLWLFHEPLCSMPVK